MMNRTICKYLYFPNVCQIFFKIFENLRLFLLFQNRVSVSAMEERWDEVHDFLSQGIYPAGMN